MKSGNTSISSVVTKALSRAEARFRASSTRHNRGSKYSNRTTQALLLRHFQEALIKADRHEHDGQQLGKVSREQLMQTLRELCPCKSRRNFEALERALVHDCRGPSRVVAYLELFEDDSDGNQGHFVESLRDQYLDEVLTYANQLEDSIKDAASQNRAEGTMNSDELREAILKIDPKKPLGQIDEYIARGYSISIEEVESLRESDRIDATHFIKRLRAGLLKRSTPAL